ncbi:MAG: hypothetical protein HC920_17320 [Oscillatoriales cyanobacterium SM2_3_0]|nr:hypothetical protein [Oscillatoriales cyanobacterium SM2_3_0]
MGAREIGVDRFLYRVVDDSGNIDDVLVTLTIVGVNDAPTLEQDIFDRDILTNQSIAFDISNSFNDIDGDPLKYSAEGLPDGLNLDSNTGVVSGVAETQGVFQVTVTADDNNGSIASDALK